MGRRRTTGCTARHTDAPCAACARVRTRRSRARRRTPAAPPSAWHTAQARACAYVHAYRRRGAIVPPEQCDRCGLGLRLTAYRPVTRLYAWHPDPARPREIAWLCAGCRTTVRVSREPLELAWTWPGTPPAPRRSPAILAEWIAAADARATALAFASSSMQDESWLSAFIAAAADAIQELYAIGARRAEAWAPTGDSQVDARLRRWIVHERRRRERLAVPRTVEPVAAPPRRGRGSASPPPDPDEPELRPPFDVAVHERRTAQALVNLARAEALLDETNARVEAALRRITGRP